MEVLLNEGSLLDSDVQEISNKVRVLLLDKDNNILIANYSGVIMLPGGKLDNNETISEAICRELKEELGQIYTPEELTYFMTLKHYQKDYPKVMDNIVNRLVETSYFIGSYKDINIDSQSLSEKEKNGNFRLELVSLNDLEEKILNNKVDNPRNKYFQDELLAVINCYKKNNE